MRISLCSSRLVALAILGSLPTVALAASPPTVAQALQLRPTQKDVDFDQPTADEAAKCTMKAEKAGGKTGWVVRDPGGKILRNFLDTNGDNQVDLWSYFKDGAEVYRDVDSNFNGKPDQCRWLNVAGTRWGIDKNEDRVIDFWQVISPEELSAEVVAALRDEDVARFKRLVVSPRELSTLGLSATKLQEMQKRAGGAPPAFVEYLKTQKVVTPQSHWVYFGGSRPSIVPQGTDESTADVFIYENVAALVETDKESNQVSLGTLVRVGESWRLLDAPGTSETYTPRSIQDKTASNAEGNGPSEAVQKLMDEYAKLDQSGDQSVEANKRRAEILEELTANTKGDDRAGWIKQLADVVGAATQDNRFPGGVELLGNLTERLEKAGETELAAHVEFRQMTAGYNHALSQPDVDYPKLQTKWLEQLEAYVAKYPTAPNAAEAMSQLALAEEFSGDDTNAIKWYKRIGEKFPDSRSAVRATGAVRRIESVGHSIPFKGKTLGGKMIDLSQYRDKVVLIHYWASDVDACTKDMPLLEKLQNKYAGQFVVIGVSLDNDRQAVENYVRRQQIPWAQIWEQGGLDSRLANELGVQIVPTMILIDTKGKVVNRSAHAEGLDNELGGLQLKARVAKLPLN